MTKSKIIERIEAEAGIAGLLEVLADRLTPTDLQSLLLEVYRLRAQQLQPAQVLADYEKNRFVRPSMASPLVLKAWERVCFEQLPADFQAIDLAPVAPLGTNSVMAAVDQNWAMSTARNTEVVADSTNVLALECAIQRRQLLRNNPKSKEIVSRACNHRLLRTQNYGNPKQIAHFSAFALCSAGQDRGNLRFELSTLVTHIAFYLRALRAFLGESIPLRAAISDFNQADRREVLDAGLFAPLREQFPRVEVVMDDQRTGGRGYYADLCFHVYAANAEGQFLELADGGAVDWTQKLLSNAKERCMISGIGSERVCLEFTPIQR